MVTNTTLFVLFSRYASPTEGVLRFSLLFLAHRHQVGSTSNVPIIRSSSICFAPLLLFVEGFVLGKLMRKT